MRRGTLTAQIAALVPGGQVIGIDASEGMIAAAQPKARQNLRFVRMDINDLSFSAEFDVAFSNATWMKMCEAPWSAVARHRLKI